MQPREEHPTEGAERIPTGRRTLAGRRRLVTTMERFGRKNVERTVPAQARDRRRVGYGPGTIHTATSGTLTFLAGESTERIDVSELDDAHNEGEETLTLSSAS